MIHSQADRAPVVTGDPTDPPSRTGFLLPPGLARWAPAAWGGLLGAVMFAVTWQAMPDDALITLSFVRNLVDRGEWAITPGLEVNTATSPLMVWLEAALYLVSGKHAIVAAGALVTGSFAAIAAMLHRLGGRSAALLGPALLATSPWLTASVGMETIPGIALLVALVLASVRHRWPAVAVAVAAAPLLRPDLTVGALAVLVLCAAAHRTWVPTALAAAAGAALVVPWYAFSWWHFGSVWPLTLPVKALQSGWGENSASLATALPYWFSAAPTSTVIVVAGFLIAAISAAATALCGRWPEAVVPAVLLVGGASEFAALASTATSPTIYYPGILVGSAACALAVASSQLRWARWTVPVCVAAGIAFLGASAPDFADGNHPLRQNWATNAQYAQIAHELPIDRPVMSASEIGALAYYCLDRGCRVVDPYLADPGRVRAWTETWLRQHPWAALNYRHLSLGPATVTPYQIKFGMLDDPALPPFSDCRPGDITVYGGGHDAGTARVVVVDGERPGTPAVPR